jgi:hypothetical protein
VRGRAVSVAAVNDGNGSGPVVGVEIGQDGDAPNKKEYRFSFIEIKEKRIFIK